MPSQKCASYRRAMWHCRQDDDKNYFAFALCMQGTMKKRKKDSSTFCGDASSIAHIRISRSDRSLNACRSHEKLTGGDQSNVQIGRADHATLHSYSWQVDTKTQLQRVERRSGPCPASLS